MFFVFYSLLFCCVDLWLKVAGGGSRFWMKAISLAAFSEARNTIHIVQVMPRRHKARRRRQGHDTVDGYTSVVSDLPIKDDALRKRAEIVRRIKEERYYQLVAHNASVAIPVTPDPADMKVGKRSFERLLGQWKEALHAGSECINARAD